MKLAAKCVFILHKNENCKFSPPDMTAPLLISKMFISFLWALDFFFQRVLHNDNEVDDHESDESDYYSHFEDD